MSKSYKKERIASIYEKNYLKQIHWLFLLILQLILKCPFFSSVFQSLSFLHLFILQLLLYIKQLILTIYIVSVDICMHKNHEFLKNTYIKSCIQVIIILCKFEFLVQNKEIAHELENSKIIFFEIMPR